VDISNTQTIINNSDRLCIEIGGPTPQGYIFLKELGLTLPKNIIVTNISNPIILKPFSDNPTKHRVDAVLDITKMSYKKGEVDMVITSSLPHKLHDVLFEKSSRVLRSGGLLIIENEQPSDYQHAVATGFRPLLSSKISKKLSSQIYQH